MATVVVSSSPIPIEVCPITAAAPDETASIIRLLGANSTVASIDLGIQAPFAAIYPLFDHMLNATYNLCGSLRASDMHKTASDQKFTIDLSPNRNTLIPASLQQSLADHGLYEPLGFPGTVSNCVPSILGSLSILVGMNLTKAHKDWTMKYRFCD